MENLPHLAILRCKQPAHSYLATNYGRSADFIGALAAGLQREELVQGLTRQEILSIIYRHAPELRSTRASCPIGEGSKNPITKANIITYAEGPLLDILSHLGQRHPKIGRTWTRLEAAAWLSQQGF